MAASQARTDDELFDNITGDAPDHKGRSLARFCRGIGSVFRVSYISNRRIVRVGTDDVEHVLQALSESGNIERYDVSVGEYKMGSAYLRIEV